MRRFIFISLIKLLAVFPLSWNRKIGAVLGLLLIIVKSRMYHTSKINIEKCFPSHQAKEKKGYCWSHVKTVVSALLKLRGFGVEVKKYINDNVNSVEGLELLQSKKKGVVLVGLHLGNWEFLFNWLPQHLDLKIMFREFKERDIDYFIKNKRERTGAQMIEGKRENINEIREHLNQGKPFLLLADQEPLQGSGVFADFYGHSAYTMATVQKLAQRTNAEIVIVVITRGKKGFDIEFEELDLDYKNTGFADFSTQLNKKFEEKINLHPEQYQWSYKRFKTTPDGSQNFYYK